MILHTLAVVLHLGAPALGQAPVPPDAPDAAEAPTAASPLDISLGLRSEYLVGEKVLVPITFANGGTTPVTVPDLSSRPWLVSFKIESADGRTQRRRTAPPEMDSGRTVTLAPRARRFTLLELPSGSAFPAGAYTLTATVDLDGKSVELPPVAVELVQPRPVAGLAARTTRNSFDTLWVHQAEDGFDMYLHQLDAAKPANARGHWYLGHVDQRIEPVLAEAAAADSTSRWVVWLQGGRELTLAQIQGTSFGDVPRSLTVPWPKVALAAAPMMDGRGRIGVPLWVPAPAGNAGEVRILAFGDRGTPVFRRVGKYKLRPTVRTVVDDAGNTHMLVGHGTSVDLFSSRADVPERLELPVAGRRLIDLAQDEKLLDARFVVLPTAGGKKGGLTVQLTTRRAAGAATRLVSMGGTSLAELPPIPMTEADRVVRAVPGGWLQPGVVIARDGALRLEQPSGTAPLGGITDGQAGWQVVRAADGQPMLVRLEDGGPVSVSPLTLRPRS